MATVRELLAAKGAAVASVIPTATVLEAARTMGEHGYGAILVRDGATLLGIFTERDMLRRVVAAGLEPSTTAVASVMTSNVRTCLPETTLDECSAIMTTHRFRHLPVVDDAGLHGIVSIGDLLAHRVREQDATIRYLNEYMFNAR